MNIEKAVIKAGVFSGMFVFLVMAVNPVYSATPTERRARVIEATAKGAAGLPELRAALNDEDLIVRRTAARGLVRVGEPAADILVGALRNDDNEVRRIAMAALNDMGKLTTEQLLAALEDNDEIVRGAAAEMLKILERWNFLPDIPGDEFAPVLELIGGTKLIAKGPSGLSLDVQYCEEGSRQGAFVSNHPKLSPEGAFSIEATVSPKPELAKMTWARLVDKMAINVDHSSPTAECLRDYSMVLRRVGTDRHRVTVFLGFDREGGRADFNTEPMVFEPGEWYHIVFTYNGEGEGKIYINGELAAEENYPDKGAIVPGRRGVSIGERGISTYSSFPGYIDNVRIYHRVIEVE